MTQRDDAPMYQQVAAALRAQINNLQLLPGQKLPSEQDLAETYGVVRMTVRRALDVLREEGLIITTKGRGSVVRTEHPSRTLHMNRYRDEVRRVLRGEPGPATQEVGVETTVVEMPADATVANNLGVADGTPVLRRRRLATWMRAPYAWTTSYYPLDLVAGTPIATDAPGVVGGIFDLAAVGVRVTRQNELVHARLPSKDEQKELRIVMPAAVLAVTRTRYAGHRVVEFAWDVVYPGDRAELEYDIDLTADWTET